MSVLWRRVALWCSKLRREARKLQPITDVSSPADLILPPRQQISYTDFRIAISFALESLQRGSPGPQSQRLVFILTDSEPWPAKGPLDVESKNRYFGNAQEVHPDSLASSVTSLRESAADLFVIALDDKQADARHWMDLLPKDHYVSNRSNQDLDAAIRQILLGLVGSSCGKTVLSGTATPPQKAPTGGQSTSHSGSTRAPLIFPSPWYEIVLASAGALLGAVASRALSRRPQPTDAAKGTPPISIEDEEDQEPVDVEELRRRGRKIASTDLNKAKEFFERALEKTERTAQEGEEFASVQIPAIFREILTTIFKDDLHAQREYIYQQASLKSSRQRAQGLAPVLVERWSINSELMLEEFFALQHHPRGVECLQALAEFEPSEDWSPERLALVRLIRDIATAEDDLQRTAEFYNG